ncbi:MAG: D-glycero-beta-D-manno-heptose 1-phosphate adenylyltransferase [Actinomycetota bacterium]
MTPTPWERLDSFHHQRVLVVGEAMLDSYLEGASSRLCQEAPVPIVAVSSRSDAPGGAANVAVNVCALGGRARLLSVVGADQAADTVRTGLEGRGVGTEDLVADPRRRTLSKGRVVSNGQLVVRVDEGTTDPVSPEVQAELVARLSAQWAHCDAVVVSDYGYGVVSKDVIDAIASLQRRDERLLVVDAKDPTRYRDAGVSAVKPNYAQVVRLLGRDLGRGDARLDGVIEGGERLLELTGAHIAAVTLDATGAVVLERDRPPYRTFARPTSDVSAAGAGDTFTSTFTLALASGADMPAAAELASAAAGVVVGKQRTATCSALELREHFSPAAKYIADAARLEDAMECHRRQRRRVVMTNGCFDIIHRGHVTYLNRAKTLGDVLVVGVNSDAGVARLKGPARPINSLEDRVQVLAALSSVDHVVVFDEETPERLIERIRPQVFVKGGDYTLEMLPEADAVRAHGGEVHILSYVEDRSTSGIIERIRASEGAAGRAS